MFYSRLDNVDQGIHVLREQICEENTWPLSAYIVGVECCCRKVLAIECDNDGRTTDDRSCKNMAILWMIS